MKYSTDRILTTHAGALPQPADLKADAQWQEQRNHPSTRPRFKARVRGAVAEIVKKQIACGIDIINDGEVGKSNFSRYARDRLGGFIEREVKASDQASTIYARDMVEFADYFNTRIDPSRRQHQTGFLQRAAQIRRPCIAQSGDRRLQSRRCKGKNTKKLFFPPSRPAPSSIG